MFALDERIAADTVEIARWALCRVLLRNDRDYPWLILVPQRDGLRELHDVAPEDRALLMDEMARASRALAAVFNPDKMNVSALGNIVLQLHIHVIARFAGDPSWPGPVRGRYPPVPYEAAALDETLDRISAALG